jgi:hypothetical protein
MKIRKPPVTDPVLAERMRITFELCEAAEEMMRCTIRRRHPELTEDEVEERIIEWYQHRPGAELGDAPGRPTHRLDHMVERYQEIPASLGSELQGAPD